MIEILSLFEKGMLLAVMLTLPPLLAAVVAGVLISLIQSLFQIQDQVLPFFVKLISVGVSLYLTGRWLGMEILNLTREAWNLIPAF